MVASMCWAMLFRFADARDNFDIYLIVLASFLDQLLCLIRFCDKNKYRSTISKIKIYYVLCQTFNTT